MRFDREEYRQLIMDLNFNKSKGMLWGSSLLAAIISFIVTMFIDSSIYFNIVIALIAGFATYFYIRKSVAKNAEKLNFLDNINSVNQTIYEDKIVEVVVSTDGEEAYCEYYYKDIFFVKQDKKNFYLYLNFNAAVIVSKDKLDDINSFVEILRQNNLIN